MDADLLGVLVDEKTTANQYLKGGDKHVESDQAVGVDGIDCFVDGNVVAPRLRTEKEKSVEGDETDVSNQRVETIAMSKSGMPSNGSVLFTCLS